MSNYANTALKEIIVCLSGSKGFCETLLEDDKQFRNKENCIAYLQVASDNIQAALNEICRGLDADQMQGVLRYAKNSRLAIHPTLSPAADRREYIVSEEDMLTILQGAVSECVFCQKEGKEAKNCPIRKALLASQVVPLNVGNTNCPYQD